MSGVKLVFLCSAFLLPALSSQAQTLPDPKPAPDATQKQLTIRVALPSTVGLVGDYASILFSKDPNKLKKLTTKSRPRTSNPTVVFTVPLPSNWITKKLTGDKP